MENPIANNSSIPQRGRGGGNYRGRRHGRGGRHNNSAQNSVISGNSPSSAPHGSDETTNTTSPPRPSRGNWRRSKNNRPSSTLEPSNSASIPPAPSERQPDENIPLSSSSSSVSSIPQPQQPSPKKKNNNNNRRGKQRTKNIDNITLPEDLQGILEVQLTTEKYECMCVKKWGEKSVPDPAASTSENVGWRCPGCQNVNKELAIFAERSRILSLHEAKLHTVAGNHAEKSDRVLTNVVCHVILDLADHANQSLRRSHVIVSKRNSSLDAAKSNKDSKNHVEGPVGSCLDAVNIYAKKYVTLDPAINAQSE
ncbi:hypothetical protein HK098_004858 [Nowakowskiella sp. JEL0407]|nr:hypothetical protein HK098_004858 [Nowakowskiella sp. JEL0407]